MKSYYSAGLKYCSTCRKFIDVGGLRCPKCRRALRSSPRNGKKRMRYVEVQPDWMAD